MNISETRKKFLNGDITKSEFIQMMYQEHHSKLFDYANFIKQTNIASIEIADDKIIMTSRDKGVRMICPVGDYRVAPIEALNFLDYETIDSEMIMKLVSPSDCVIDIGANMGWYAINIAKTYPQTKVHAFEPIPKTHSFLEKNMALNNVSNICSYNFGLSDECKDLTFYFYPEGSGNASSENMSGRDDAELLTCHVERLDDFVGKNNLHVDFIKCDVEGAELFAFKGGINTLQRDNPIVFTEMLRKWAAKFGYHPNEIITLFSDIGYKCFVAQEERLVEFLTMDENTIETNFFFLHAEAHRKQIDTLLA